MSGVAHLLDASITSALALKPSTVYVLRVENSKTRAAWHLRKCFSEFGELREKVIALIDGTSVTSSSSSTTSTLSSTSSNASTSGSFDSHSSSGSELSCNSSTEASIAKSSSTTTGCDRFPYLYKQFPRRQLFGSRSKRVIEQRTHALNAFLRQLLLFVREVKQQNQIAVYFSVMNFVEPFFECAAHAASSVASNSYGTVTTSTSFNFNTFSLNSPSTLARTQAAAAAAARAAVAAPLGFHRHQHHPQSPFTYNDDDDDEGSSEEDESDRESAAAVGPADVASNKNNFNFARRFYQEYGTTTTSTSRDSDSDDDEETKLVLGLKKTASCIGHRELKEMKMHFSGSHYAPMQSIDATTTATSGGRTVGGMSASDAWAARIEIAGFSSATAGRANNSNSSSAQVQNSSKLAVGANHVRHHPNHSSNKKASNAETSPVRPRQQQPKQQLSHKYESEQKTRETQAASIVYASSKQLQQQQPSSISSKAMLFKQKQLHASAAAGRSRQAGREERPEWA